MENLVRPPRGHDARCTCETCLLEAHRVALKNTMDKHDLAARQKELYGRLGWCWHEWEEAPGHLVSTHICKHGCGMTATIVHSAYGLPKNIDLTSSDGFFKLLKAMRARGDWEKFLDIIDAGTTIECPSGNTYDIQIEFIDPATFFNGVYSFFNLARGYRRDI